MFHQKCRKRSDEITSVHFVVVPIFCLDWLKPSNVMIMMIMFHRKGDQICGYQRQRSGQGVRNWVKAVKKYNLPVIRNRY